LLVAGYPAFKSMPGCLDYRKCKRVGMSESCGDCEHYFHEWKNCYKPGYHPVIDLVVG
jgi:hypothetical protein